MEPDDFSSRAPGRVLRTSMGYWAFVPDPLPPAIEWSAPLIAALGEAERHLGRLAALGDTLPSPHSLVQPFIRREAVLSARIEGSRASLADAYRYEAGQRSFFEDPAGVHEVHNAARAVEHGLARLETLPISLRLIREIHAILMAGVRGEAFTPGEFRRSQNWIGPPGSTIESATLVPPPADEMNRALDAWERFIHAPSDLPLLVRAGLLHTQFEAIHPFLDGNGRVGRLVVILSLIDWGLISHPWLVLSGFFEAHRSDYYHHLLAVSRRGEWERWLLFFLRGISDRSLDAIARIERLGQLRAAYRERLRPERAAARLMQAVDVLFGRPILTIRQLEAALGVPYRTAQRYVERLAEIGVVREVTGRARNRLYRADEILRALEGP